MYMYVHIHIYIYSRYVACNDLLEYIHLYSFVHKQPGKTKQIQLVVVALVMSLVVVSIK